MMTTCQISRFLGTLVISAQLLACPAYAQDWFLPRTEQLLPIRHHEPEKFANLLRWMVPEVEIQISGRELRVEGHAGDLAVVRELVAELDQISLGYDLNLKGTYVETQGSLEWLASKRIVARLGKSVGLELKGAELELNLDLEVTLGARYDLETNIQLKRESDAPHECRVSRLLPDGSALIVTGFADQQLPKRQESEEYVLVLVPYLMR